MTKKGTFCAGCDGMDKPSCPNYTGERACDRCRREHGRGELITGRTGRLRFKCHRHGLYTYHVSSESCPFGPKSTHATSKSLQRRVV